MSGRRQELLSLLPHIIFTYNFVHVPKSVIIVFGVSEAYVSEQFANELSLGLGEKN